MTRLALPVGVLVGVLVGGLAALLTLELAGSAPAGQPDMREALSRADDGAPAAPPGPPELDALGRQVLARPLFRPGRTAPTAMIAVVSPKPPPPPLPRLSAVVTRGTEKLSIFSPSGGGKPVVVTEGGSVGPYTVLGIATGSVTLQGPDGAKLVQPVAPAHGSSPPTGHDPPPHG